MTNKVFGYVRVSSTDQNVDRQMKEIYSLISKVVRRLSDLHLMH